MIIYLMGPTASGKTQLAVELVKRFPLEIISVDSAMIYRGMDIGTAKPTAEILRRAPHRLLNIRDPRKAYSAAQFRQDALHEIKDILAQGKVPLLVGGTMLYFRVLQQGLAPIPSANSELRARITREGEQLGWPVLHERLQKVDPESAQRIHPHDSQRIQRALEVYTLTGENLSAWQKKPDDLFTHFKIISLIIAPSSREILHQRIAERFKMMLAEGFVEEVKHLFARGDLDLTMPSMRSVGYRQVWQYLEGKYDFETMTEKGIIATRQLAKRQLTWLRSWPGGVWFDSEGGDLVEQVSEMLRPLLSSVVK